MFRAAPPTSEYFSLLPKVVCPGAHLDSGPWEEFPIVLTLSWWQRNYLTLSLVNLQQTFPVGHATSSLCQASLSLCTLALIPMATILLNSHKKKKNWVFTASPKKDSDCTGCNFGILPLGTVYTKNYLSVLWLLPGSLESDGSRTEGEVSFPFFSFFLNQ